MNVDALAPEDRQLWDAMGAATPCYSSAPRPGAMHELAACRAVAAILGTPLLPWQAWFARLATERSERDPARYRFPIFMLTVPRQAGKTTIVRVILLTRALLYQDRRAFYTAQTGKDATERWADLCAAVMANTSPLAPFASLRRAAGSARLTITPTGSRISPFAPTPESLHGYTPHDVAGDELFAFSDSEGSDLEGAIIPAQLTIASRQFLGLSTAGHRDSTYLRRKVNEGRRAATEGGDSGYLEWSLADGLDPYAPESWRFHPAYGLTQFDEDFRSAAETLPPGEWLRAMCNVWTESTDPLFDMGAYDRCGVPELPSVGLGATCLGVGVTPDRTRAAAVAAWPLGSSTGDTSRIGVKLVKVFDDVSELAPWLTELARLPQDARPVIYGAAGAAPVRAVLDEVRRAVQPVVDASASRLDRRVVELDSREWQLASEQLHSSIVDTRLAHEPSEGAPALRSAVARALARSGVDGAWTIAHSSPAELTALAAAVRGARVKQDAPTIKIRS